MEARVREGSAPRGELANQELPCAISQYVIDLVLCGSRKQQMFLLLCCRDLKGDNIGNCFIVAVFVAVGDASGIQLTHLLCFLFPHAMVTPKFETLAPSQAPYRTGLFLEPLDRPLSRNNCGDRASPDMHRQTFGKNGTCVKKSGERAE